MIPYLQKKKNPFDFEDPLNNENHEIWFLKEY